MPSHNERHIGVWIVSNRRFVSVVAAALLLAASITVVMTAPISELSIGIRNGDDIDDVIMFVYLDSSRVEVVEVDPGEWTFLKLHVSPGKHSIGADFSFEDHPDLVIDYILSIQVDFNEWKEACLHVERAGISQGIYLPDRMAPRIPLLQAMEDPHVMGPAAAITMLNVLLVAAVWNYRRKETDRVENEGKQ